MYTHINTLAAMKYIFISAFVRYRSFSVSRFDSPLFTAPVRNEESFNFIKISTRRRYQNRATFLIYAQPKVANTKKKKKKIEEEKLALRALAESRRAAEQNGVADSATVRCGIAGVAAWGAPSISLLAFRFYILFIPYWIAVRRECLHARLFRPFSPASAVAPTHRKYLTSSRFDFEPSPRRIASHSLTDNFDSDSRAFPDRSAPYRLLRSHPSLFFLSPRLSSRSTTWSGWRRYSNLITFRLLQQSPDTRRFRTSELRLTAAFAYLFCERGVSLSFLRLCATRVRVYSRGRRRGSFTEKGTPRGDKRASASVYTVRRAASRFDAQTQKR